MTKLLERNAANFATYTTAIELQIKETVLHDLLNGQDKQETFQKIKRIIAEFVGKIHDVNVRLQFEKGLSQGAVKIYRQTADRLRQTSESLAVPIVYLGAIVFGRRKPLSPAGSSEMREYLFEDRIEVPELRKKVKAELERLIADISDVEIKDVRGSTLRNLAEMHVRREYQQTSIKQMRANGVKLVWASTHVDCSKRCFPWQGKLYSLDGTYGKTETGVSYQPLENAVNVSYTTRSGKTYMNGLLGFNCRHRLIPYNDKQEPPKGFTREQTEKAVKLDEQQRKMEREIRKVKQRAFLLRGVQDVEKDAAGNLFAQARKMTEEYRAFCRKNNRVAMIFRTQVTTQEQNFNLRRQQTVFKNVLDADTGEVLVAAGTRFDKVRLIAGDGSKATFRDARYYANSSGTVEPLTGNVLHFRKLSGIITQGGKGKDVVHWAQDESGNKAEEKDGRPKPKR